VVGVDKQHKRYIKRHNRYTKQHNPSKKQPNRYRKQHNRSFKQDNHCIKQDKDGVMKPGSKGLSMPLDQYRALLSGVDAINAAVENGGQEVRGVAS
jgi:hypothetical protein